MDIAARARRGHGGTGAVGVEYEADLGDPALRHQASVSKQRRPRRSTAAAGDFRYWLLLLGLLALAAFLYVDDPGMKVAEWRLKRRRLSEGFKEHKPLPSLEEDPEVVAVFSKLVAEEEELGKLVHSFEDGVDKFEEFGKELDEQRQKRILEEDIQEVQAQEKAFALKESLEADEQSEQQALESMFLNSQNAKQIEEQDAIEDRRRQNRHHNNSYTIIQILQAASSPLPMRLNVDEAGTTTDPVETNVAFSTSVSSPEEIDSSSFLAKNPSLVQWAPPDESERVLVAVWQGSSSSDSKEGSDGQPLFFSYSVDSGGNWQEPVRVVQLAFSAAWTPQLFVDKSNELWLFFTRSRLCSMTTSNGRVWAPGGDVMAMVKPRLHALWSEPREIVAQLSKSPPFLLSGRPVLVAGSGTIALPFWTEHLAGQPVCTSGSEGGVFRKNSSKERWTSSAGVITSSDDGDTWSVRGRVDNVGVPLMGGALVQMEVLKSLEGMVGHNELIMFLYSQTGAVFRTTSFDIGKTWMWPQLLHLPNPASRLTAISFQDSNVLILAFNNHPKTTEMRSGPCTSCVTRLSLAMSRDRGKTWNLMGLVDSTAENEVVVAGPSLEQVSPSELGIIYFRQGPDAGTATESSFGILFSRIDAINLDEFPLKRIPAADKLTDSGRRRVIADYLMRQSRSIILRMNIRRPSWGDLAEELCQKYLLPGYPNAGALARDQETRRSFFRALEREAKSQGGDHLSKERKERLAKIQRNPNDAGVGFAGDNFGQIDLGVVDEASEVGGGIDGAAVQQPHGKHHKHRLDLGGDEAEEDQESMLHQESPLEIHSLYDVVRQDIDPATLCVRMPCCRDYGPNCVHIPHCDPDLCTIRPCCNR